MTTDIERARDLTAPYLSERPFEFDSAREAIDSVSRFESLTLDDFEYRLSAAERDGALWYRVALNSLTRGDEPRFRFRGYLTFVPRDFST